MPLQLEARTNLINAGKARIWEAFRDKPGFHRKRFWMGVLNPLPISQYKDHSDAKIGWRPIYIEVF